jgi:hypothetical protein
MLVLSQDGFMKYVSNPSDSCGARPHQQIPGGIDGTELHAFSEDGSTLRPPAAACGRMHRTLDRNQRIVLTRIGKLSKKRL